MVTFFLGSSVQVKANDCTQMEIIFANGNADNYLSLFSVLRDDLNADRRTLAETKRLFDMIKADEKELVVRCAPERYEIVLKEEKRLENELKQALEFQI
jgi:hypothetical protein